MTFIFGFSLARTGCGKTYLLSRIVESTQSNGLRIYFYFDAKARGDQRWAITLVRTLVYQLLKQQSQLVQHVEDFYFNNGSQTIDSFEHFEPLFEVFKTMTSKVGPLFKLLVSSRDDDVEVQRLFGNANLLSITGEDTSDDIQRYLEHRLATIHAVHLRNEPFKTEIRDSLTSAADGMILWASLVFDDLENQDSLAATRKALQKLPRKLETIYTEAVEKLGKAHANTIRFASFALGWLVDGFRMMTLQELEEACQVRIQSRELDRNSKPFDIELALKRSCGPFVRIYANNNVSLSHFSAKEFLATYRKESERALLAPQRIVHRSIGLTCAAYLNLKPFQSGRIAFDDSEQHMYPLLGYATQYWHLHITKSDISASGHVEMLNSFLRSENFRTWIIQYHRHISGPIDYTYSIGQLKAIISEVQTWLHHLAAKFSMHNQPEGDDQVIAAFEHYKDDTVRLFGLHNKEAINATMSLARLYADHMNYEEACHLYQEGLECMEYVYGSDNKQTLFASVQYARYLRDSGNMSEATQLFHSIYDRLESFLGQDHPFTILTIGGIAYHNTIAGNQDMAYRMYSECIRMSEEEFGELHPNTLGPLSSLGWHLTCYGPWNEAEKYLHMSLERTIRA
ncbi:hypothetical protein INS49_005907 [Diaporthe citri]|uniref:uncharacterized protein n=1 Tax=Diaporthe citri TaxID=83186 RepID=UPI001C80E289|nr:uncharacterized protein INS49_005907 [Diaporthe citri]KAG6364307.1 hypothetical protein INS49_005907 [Diaporthe citri]